MYSNGEMATTIEVISLVIGTVGLLFAIYSIIGQKKLETRIREKEKLKALSIKLEPLIQNIKFIVEDIKNPIDNDDLFFELQSLGQGIISKAYDDKEDIVDLSILIKIPSGKKTDASNGKEESKHSISIEKKEDIIKVFQEFYNIDISAQLGNSIYSYSLSDYYAFFSPPVLEDIEILQREFGNLIKDFNPDILENLKDCIKEMLMITIDSALHSKKLKVNIKSFSKTDDLSLWIFNEVIGRNKLDPYLIKLEKLKAELEKLREILITTSYT